MFLLKTFNQITDLYDLLRVQTYGRLIQNDNFRITKDCLCQTNPLPVTFGQVLDQTIFHVRDLYHIHDFFYHGFLFIFWNFFEISNEIHIFAYCHIEIKRRHFRQIANAFFCLLRFIQYIMTIDSYRSLRRCYITGNHVHGCRFTSSVWPQKAVDFAFLNLKRKVVNCCVIPIAFDQIVYFNHKSLLLFFFNQNFLLYKTEDASR